MSFFAINSLVYVLRGPYNSRIGQVIGVDGRDVTVKFEEKGGECTTAYIDVAELRAHNSVNSIICERINQYTDDVQLRAVLTAAIYEGYYEHSGDNTLSPKKYGRAWRFDTAEELAKALSFVDTQRKFAGLLGETCTHCLGDGRDGASDCRSCRGTGFKSKCPHDNAATCDCPRETALDAKYGGVHDAVNHPKHYNSHPSGIECIEVTRHMGFNLGNAIKYIWRADLKNDAIEDLKKARWYLDDEIAKREKAAKP